VRGHHAWPSCAARLAASHAAVLGWPSPLWPGSGRPSEPLAAYRPVAGRGAPLCPAPRTRLLCRVAQPCPRTACRCRRSALRCTAVPCLLCTVLPLLEIMCAWAWPATGHYGAVASKSRPLAPRPAAGVIALPFMASQPRTPCYPITLILPNRGDPSADLAFPLSPLPTMADGATSWIRKGAITTAQIHLALGFVIKWPCQSAPPPLERCPTVLQFWSCPSAMPLRPSSAVTHGCHKPRTSSLIGRADSFASTYPAPCAPLPNCYRP
jgi:hypothetical protein